MCVHTTKKMHLREGNKNREKSWWEQYKDNKYFLQQTLKATTTVTQLPWWLIILLSGLVGSRVFSVSWSINQNLWTKCKSNWKVQASIPKTNTGWFKCKQNRFMYCHKFDWGNENSEFGHVWVTQLLSKITSPYPYPLSPPSLSPPLSLSLYAVCTSNTKWLLTESSCFIVANTLATLFQRIPSTLRRRSGWIVSFRICVSFKHIVGIVKIDKQTIWKRIWHR